MKNNNCKKINDVEKGHYIDCTTDANPSKEPIEFVFGNTKISLRFDNLNPVDEESYFHSNPFHHLNFGGFILGNQFIKLFDYVLFDIESKQIELYSDEFQMSFYRDYRTQKLLLKMNILMMIILLIILIYRQIKLKLII